VAFGQRDFTSLCQRFRVISGTFFPDSQKSALRDILSGMDGAIDEFRFGHEDAAGLEQPSHSVVCCSALRMIALFIDETEFKVGYALQV
jgi:hypothetical protein